MAVFDVPDCTPAALSRWGHLQCAFFESCTSMYSVKCRPSFSARIVDVDKADIIHHQGLQFYLQCRDIGELEQPEYVCKLLLDSGIF